MNNNLKKIIKQIETARKSYSVIQDNLKNSMPVVNNLRAIDIYRQDSNTTNLMIEHLRNSQSAIDSLKASTNYHQDIIKRTTMIDESLSSSKAAIDALRASTMQYQDIINTVNMMNESLKSSQYAINHLKDLNTHQNEITDNISLMRSSLNDIERITQEFNVLKYNSIISFVNNLDLDLISKKYENRFSGKYTEQFDLFIRNNGWLIPNCASEEFIDSLYYSFDNGEDIDKKFVDYFSDNDFSIILELKEKWNSENLIPKGNLKIISNAINLILNNNGSEYSDIIIPSLLAQIDALISEVLVKNGFNEINRKYYSEFYESKDKNNINTFIKNFAGHIIDDWEEHHVNFLLENLFASNYGSEIEDATIMNFNRHNILHGLDNEYGTFENLIRCLLVIDFLNDFLSDDLYYRLN